MVLAPSSSTSNTRSRIAASIINGGAKPKVNCMMRSGVICAADTVVMSGRRAAVCLVAGNEVGSCRSIIAAAERPPTGGHSDSCSQIEGDSSSRGPLCAIGAGARSDAEIDFLHLFVFFQIDRLAFKHGAAG